MEERAVEVRKDLLTDKSGGFNNGLISINDEHDVALKETAISRPARNGYVYCKRGEVEVKFNQGETITLSSGDIINITPSNEWEVFEVSRISIKGIAAESTYRLVLW